MVSRTGLLTVVAIALSLLLNCHAAVAADAESVQVKYTKGATDLAVLKAGVKFFNNRNYALDEIPSEVDGLTFSRRPIRNPADVSLTIPAGTTVYVMVDSDTGKNKNLKGVRELNNSLSRSGWTRVAEFTTDKSPLFGAIYKQQFSGSKSITIAAGGGNSGVTVVAKNLALLTEGNQPANPPDAGAAKAAVFNHTLDDKPLSGPTTRLIIPQSSIKCLAVQHTDAGLALGCTTEVVLTAMRSDTPKRTVIWFATPVGNDMNLAAEDAMRYVELSYPNWYVDRAEITFEDKYDAHDGGSIGAAIGTLSLSLIRGFAIDPNVAMTGDVGANGKVQMIGGVAAKLRGAIAGKCTLVALPMENFEQVVDAVTYSGPAIAGDVQIIGIFNLDDAQATVRIDRGQKLTKALSLFSQVQQGIKGDPNYLKTPDAKEILSQVIKLAPQHISASVLLALAEGKQPKTLSATATAYYTSLAARNMMSVLVQRSQEKDRLVLPSGVIRSGLADLRKLLPLADATVRPLINSWVRFIQAWNDFQEGSGTAQNVDNQRQSLLDEMAKENTNPELMQKMVREGV